MADDGVVELADWRARRGAAVNPAAPGWDTAEETPLAALSRGRPGAVEACLDAYGGLVLGLARRLLPEHADVEDAVHEIFIELWRSAERFDPDRASDRGFVAMLARRRIIDRRRRRSARPETVRWTPAAERPGTDHERTLGRVEAQPALEALETLDPDRRRWILMNVVEGWSHRDIARETDTPLGTVKSGIRRGLRQMRDWLEERRDEGREVGR